MVFLFLRLIRSPCISKHHYILARLEHRKKQSITTRYLELYHAFAHKKWQSPANTTGDPNAPPNFFDPRKWTKPSKKDDDRTPIALFVVDEMPLQVNISGSQLCESDAKHSLVDSQKENR